MYSLKIDDSFLDSYGEYWFWESHCNKAVSKELLALVDDPTCKGGQRYDPSVFIKVKEKALKVLPGRNESYADLLVRSNKFKSETLTRIDTQLPIVVVTHSGMVNALKSEYITDD